MDTTIFLSDVAITVDGNGNQLQGPYYIMPGSTAYYFYSGTLSGNTTLDVQTDLGRKGTRGYVYNSGSNSLGLIFTINGVDQATITINAGAVFDMDNDFMMYEKIKLVYGSSTTYQVLVY